jgi:hypothetical protein
MLGDGEDDNTCAVLVALRLVKTIFEKVTE